MSVTLPVADLDRSRRFYRDQLGLVEVDSRPSTVVLASGTVRITLRHLAGPMPADGASPHLDLDVPDVAEAYERLLAKGVEFEREPGVVQRDERLELHRAVFRDPDGHRLAITRWTMRR